MKESPVNVKTSASGVVVTGLRPEDLKFAFESMSDARRDTQLRKEMEEVVRRGLDNLGTDVLAFLNYFEPGVGLGLARLLMGENEIQESGRVSFSIILLPPNAEGEMTWRWDWAGAEEAMVAEAGKPGHTKSNEHQSAQS